MRCTEKVMCASLLLFMTGCTHEHRIEVSDGTHLFNARLISENGGDELASSKYDTWVLLDTGYFIFVDETNRVGVSALRDGGATHMMPLLHQPSSMKIVSNSIGGISLIAVLDDAALRIPLNANVYLAAAVDEPAGTPNQLPHSAHFVGSIKGVGLVEGSVRDTAGTSGTTPGEMQR